MPDLLLDLYLGPGSGPHHQRVLSLVHLLFRVAMSVRQNTRLVCLGRECTGPGNLETLCMTAMSNRLHEAYCLGARNDGKNRTRLKQTSHFSLSFFTLSSFSISFFPFSILIAKH